MNQKVIFAAAAVLNLLFGLAFLIVPETFTAFYGNTLSAGGVIFARLWAASVIGLAVLLWLARDLAASMALRAIVIASLVYTVLGFVVSLIGQLNNMVNALGWSTVLLYLIFALAFGYLYFREPDGTF